MASFSTNGFVEVEMALLVLDGGDGLLAGVGDDDVGPLNRVSGGVVDLDRRLCLMRPAFMRPTLPPTMEVR